MFDRPDRWDDRGPSARWRPCRTGTALTASLAALLLLVSGCSDTDGSDPDDTPVTDEETDEATGERTEGSSEMDRSMPSPAEVDPEQIRSDVDLTGVEHAPVVAALSWLFHTLDGDELPSEEVISPAFTDTFLADVPATQLRSIFAQLSGEYRLTSARRLEPHAVVGTIDDGAGQQWDLTLEVVDEQPVRIAVLFFGAPQEPESFDDWESAMERFEGLADEVGVLAAAVDEDGGCVPIAALDDDQRGPMASVFKLYVLAALVDAIGDGVVAWDDVITVTESLISIPSGRLQNEAPGTEVTVEDAARLMISSSDNTATDLLIDLLGRQTVEDAFSAYGHAAPDVNAPLLTTRDMAQLQWQVDDDLRERYIGGDASTRRDILADLADLPLDIDLQQITQPGAPDSIEWFATPTEMCRVLTMLDRRAQEPGLEPVDGILRANTIVALDDRWTGAAAKGGSQPGVLAGVWLVERDDGKRFAFAITLLDDVAIDMPAAFAAIEGAMDLLAQSP